MSLLVLSIMFWNAKDCYTLFSLSEENVSHLNFLETYHNNEILNSTYGMIDELISSGYSSKKHYQKYLELNPEIFIQSNIESELSKYVEEGSLERFNCYLPELNSNQINPRISMLRQRMLYKSLLNYSLSLINPAHIGLDRHRVIEDPAGNLYLSAMRNSRSITTINSIKAWDREGWQFKVPYSDTLKVSSIILTLANNRTDGKLLDSLIVRETFLTNSILSSRS